MKKLCVLDISIYLDMVEKFSIILRQFSDIFYVMYSFLFDPLSSVYLPTYY